MRMALLTTGALFPAQAGVILNHSKHYQFYTAVPRASGGDPIDRDGDAKITLCSPRKRG